jgi:hypothetical protein
MIDFMESVSKMLRFNTQHRCDQGRSDLPLAIEESGHPSSFSRQTFAKTMDLNAFFLLRPVSLARLTRDSNGVNRSF